MSENAPARKRTRKTVEPETPVEETPAEETVTQSDTPAVSLPARELEYGVFNSEPVRILQRRLGDLLEREIPVSGRYLQKTRDWVRTFQRERGLVETGVLDEATAAAVFDGTEFQVKFS